MRGSPRLAPRAHGPEGGSDGAGRTRERSARSRIRRFGRLLLVALVGSGAGLLALPPASVAAQETGREAELEVLRQAARFEAQGRHARAEEVLRRLLDDRPTSSAGLYALERVLRARGALADVLPLVERYLERAPDGTGVRHLQLRVLVEVDSTGRLPEAAEAWIAAEPGSPEPYRQIARVYQRVFGPERALEVLRSGRSRVQDDALALETGDVLLSLGREEEAVEAWSRAVGDTGARVPAILRRLDEPGGRTTERAAALVDVLDRAPTTTARRRAAVRIALEAGLGGRALEIARVVATELSGMSRRGFLTDVGRRAREGHAPHLALWAWGELREGADPEERRALDVRIATTALAAGDTAAALEAQRRVARALTPGSDARRHLIADLVRVEAAGGADAEVLLQRIEGFRNEFPNADELDALASEVASALRSRGRHDEAEAVLEGVRGPRSSVERAFLLFEKGEVDEGREVLETVLPGLDPAEATGIIQLMALLDRLDGPAREAAARSAVAARQGRVDRAVQIVEEAVAGSAPGARAALLAHGARLADQGERPDVAAGLRHRLVREHPDAPETAEATLLLARWTADRPGRTEEAARLLEDLILARPGAPVVPEARRELERLRDGARGGGGP